MAVRPAQRIDPNDGGGWEPIKREYPKVPKISREGGVRIVGQAPKHPRDVDIWPCTLTVRVGLPSSAERGGGGRGEKRAGRGRRAERARDHVRSKTGALQRRMSWLIVRPRGPLGASVSLSA